MVNGLPLILVILVLLSVMKATRLRISLLHIIEPTPLAASTESILQAPHNLCCDVCLFLLIGLQKFSVQ